MKGRVRALLLHALSTCASAAEDSGLEIFGDVARVLVARALESFPSRCLEKGLLLVPDIKPQNVP